MRLKGLNVVSFTLILTAYFALVLNFPFIIKAITHMKEEHISIESTVFLSMTIPLFLFCVFFSLFSLFTVKYLEKPVFITVTLVSSVLSYGHMYYGFVFDSHSAMIATLEKTNAKEVLPFITPSFLICFFLFGVVPSYLIYKVKIVHFSIKKEILIKLLSVFVYPFFYFIIIFPFSIRYYSLIPLTGLAGKPPFEMIPNNFLNAAFNYYHDKIIAQHHPYKQIGLDAKNNSMHQNGKNNLLILVVGETARGMNFELNGYERATNPYTKKLGVISFPNMTSCGTATSVSVPCIFSHLPRAQFSNFSAENQDNLLDILKRTGVNVFWMDNNGAGDCQGVCKNITSTITDYNFDGELINELKNKIHHFQKVDTVLVLHLKGSHGQNYHTRYPNHFNQFTPACQNQEFRLCDRQTLLNAYDNSILYTDFVLHELINFLKEQDDFWNTALLYTSDHGESIGEKGIYEHGTPYLIAPQEQTSVPLIFWASDSFAEEKNLSQSCLKKESMIKKFSHDNLFHSILGLMNISTELYEKELDLFISCSTNHQLINTASTSQNFNTEY
ncbi:phosphoethanolamine transferase [Legionella sainthelensi]|uniref:Phosphoethanolamine transferase n=1 Tax=Legionella sainthelensi TaxID=28087 RepID=A0A2H5FHK4_9GAMM|nr:sulfatase-like hydrolase/transferase [Legionella sainthelensi]AUH71031.1 DUF1705 domain-containing protein [Legionella sainthelensi]